MAYTVYMHTAPSGKRYIGITSRPPEKRWESGNGYKGVPFGRAIEKYGWDNISHAILLTDLSKEDAEFWETYLIALFRTTDSKFGYNCESGGNLGKELTEETRQKLSESHIGIKHTEASKRKIGAAFKNRVFTEEHRAKLSAAMRGRPSPIKGVPKSPETRQRMSVAAKGKKVSYETRLKISEANKGKTGHPQTSETRAKIGAAKRKAIVNLDTGEQFESLVLAAELLHIGRTSISACLSGRTKTAGGYHWAYADSI